MQADMAFIQALRRAALADADRKSLDADHLFVLALRGLIELLPKERKRLSADHLFILAVRGSDQADGRRQAKPAARRPILAGVAWHCPPDAAGQAAAYSR